MNKEKSELVWVGKTKTSKKILCNNIKLSWGATEFKLLGITFTIKLDEIVNKNYNPIMGKILNTIKVWKRRSLTPLDKIVIIKSLLMSQFVHLFQTLPKPPSALILKITKVLFQFIWDDKPDKISQPKLMQQKRKGGLDMINLEQFIKCLHINWVNTLTGGAKPLWQE